MLRFHEESMGQYLFAYPLDVLLQEFGGDLKTVTVCPECFKDYEGEGECVNCNGHGYIDMDPKKNYPDGKYYQALITFNKNNIKKEGVIRAIEALIKGVEENSDLLDVEDRIVSQNCPPSFLIIERLNRIIEKVKRDETSTGDIIEDESEFLGGVHHDVYVPIVEKNEIENGDKKAAPRFLFSKAYLASFFYDVYIFLLSADERKIISDCDYHHNCIVF